MPSYVVKVSPDADEYVYWSDVVDDVHCIGTRAEVENYLRQIGHGEDLPARFARADKTGTSAIPGFYHWDSSGFVAAQRGYLPRARLAEYARLRCADDDRAWDLLNPFEDDDEPSGAVSDTGRGEDR
jgi:hypothetical protein